MVGTPIGTTTKGDVVVRKYLVVTRGGLGVLRSKPGQGQTRQTESVKGRIVGSGIGLRRDTSALDRTRVRGVMPPRSTKVSL